MVPKAGWKRTFACINMTVWPVNKEQKNKTHTGREASLSIVDVITLLVLYIAKLSSLKSKKLNFAYSSFKVHSGNATLL